MTGTLGDARWRVLWPPRREPRVPARATTRSVVLDVRGGGMPPSLLLGDLSASPQRALAASGALDPPYDVVKVAHHGSADQDAALYALADPPVALVTVGADNDYGHPAGGDPRRCSTQLGARIARTDVRGDDRRSGARADGRGGLARARRARS